MRYSVSVGSLSLSIVLCSLISYGNAGTLRTVAMSGDVAPGTTGNVTYRHFHSGNVSLNSAGQTAFKAFVTGAGVNDSNELGIWSEGSGSLSLVSRTGDQPPGTSSGVIFEDFFSKPVLNNAGQIALTGFLAGTGVDTTNNNGIWSEGSGSLKLLARKGEQAPGMPVGVAFWSFGTPGLNSTGKAIISATWRDGRSTRKGIWAENQTGNLELIASEDVLLEIAPGDFRMVRGLSFGGFNDHDQIAFRASFMDETQGVFVFNHAAVPEPNTLLLGALASIGLMIRRRL